MSDADAVTPVPNRERVLRRLFWQLLFRGRAVAPSSGKKPLQVGLGWQLVGYALIGLLPALTVFRLDAFAFACTLHTYTMMFASLTLATTAGTMLFVREEAEILLHRPVRAEEVLRAKMYVLVRFTLLLALALNAVGMVAVVFVQTGGVLVAAMHVVSTMLLMAFSAAAVVLVYDVCLRRFGRERLDNLIAVLQTVLTIVMIVGCQLMPRLLTRETMQRIDLTQPWALALPPVWFGALDALVSGAAPVARTWLPAAIGVVVTVGLCWLAFVKLGASYGRGLMLLNEAQSPTGDERRARWLLGLLRTWPLRWWLRDPVERQAFLLASAYLVRDREVKLKLYPGIAPIVLMPVVLVVGMPRSDAAGPNVFLNGMACAYCAMVPIQALILLRRSAHWRAAAIFRVAPIDHWAPLFHGARKAVLLWLAVPALVFVAGLMAILRGTWDPVLMALPLLVILPVASLAPGMFADWLPLSEPNDEVRNAGMGCLVLAVVTGSALVVCGVSGWLLLRGWFWPFLAGVVLVGALLRWSITAGLRRRRWRTAEE